MPRTLTGPLNDGRGRAWHGMAIEFKTADNDEWRTGYVHKHYGAPTVINLGDHKYVVGRLVTEFVIRRDLPKSV